MSSVEARPPAPPASTGRYAGPERRRFGTPPTTGELLPGERVLKMVPSALDAATLQSDRSGVVDQVQEAVCAALCGDAPLFELIRHRIVVRCVRHPLLGAAAAGEIDRLLAVDIVQRHVLACDKRRRLQRELAALADALRLPPPAA
jgi:hypothetical protein